MIYEKSDSTKKPQLYHEDDNILPDDFYGKKSSKISLTKNEDEIDSIELVKQSSKTDINLNEDYVLLYKTSNENQMLMFPATVGNMGLNVQSLCNGYHYTLIGYFNREGNWIQKGSGEISDINLVNSRDSVLFPITNRKYRRDQFYKKFYDILKLLNIIALFIGTIKIDPIIILMNMATFFFLMSYEELSNIKYAIQDFAKIKREYRYFSHNIETKEILLEKTIGVTFYKRPVIIWLRYDTSQEILKDVVSDRCLNSFRFYKQIYKVKLYNLQEHVLEKWKNKYPYFINDMGEIVIFVM